MSPVCHGKGVRVRQHKPEEGREGCEPITCVTEHIKFKNARKIAEIIKKDFEFLLLIAADKKPGTVSEFFRVLFGSFVQCVTPLDSPPFCP
jgi:hypothetical protein